MFLLEIADTLGALISFAGVLTIVVGTVLAVLLFFKKRFQHVPLIKNYHSLRRNLGRAILLGLEFLVAGDIIRSVTGDPNLQSVLILGLIVIIRSFLGITFEMEIDGRWPWQKAKRTSGE